MKQVITAYGKFLLEGIVLVLLIIIFSEIRDEEGKKGIFAAIGAKLQIENTDYNTYFDFQNVYQSECNKDSPKIEYFGSNMQVGVNRLADFIRATDYAGRVLPIKVDSIENPNGVELLDDYHNDTTEVNMEQPGVYIVTIRAFDDSGRSTQCVIKIPVNSFD